MVRVLAIVLLASLALTAFAAEAEVLNNRRLLRLNGDVSATATADASVLAAIEKHKKEHGGKKPSVDVCVALATSTAEATIKGGKGNANADSSADAGVINGKIFQLCQAFAESSSSVTCTGGSGCSASAHAEASVSSSGRK